MSAAPKLEGSPLFNKDVIQAFATQVIATIEAMASTPTKVGKPFIEQTPESRGHVAGMVGMVAPPLKSTMLLTFPKATILKIIENMLGEVHTEINGDVNDAVGEMTNQIYASTKTKLNQMGHNFEMAIPTVISGNFVVVRKKSHTANLVIPFDIGNDMKFFLEVCVE